MPGWAIPCATDIAFSAMLARAIFPAKHPAIPFLLLLAIADDALGLVILALFYPSGPASLVRLSALMIVAIGAARWLRARRVRSFWPYLIGPGACAWAALHFGGVHPALSLATIIPFLPHSSRDRGLFDHEEELQLDTLSRLEHWWATPVQFVLLFFGLVNAGVRFEQVGAGTYFVLAGLLFGKPVGIVTFSMWARLAGARLPRGLDPADLLIVGMTAALGFTVSLFFATAAFPPGEALAQTKMGALFSFSAAPLAFAAARILRRDRAGTP
jgi:NhaA family Na+:H+ antiporter